MSQDRNRLELYTKQVDGGWLLTDYEEDDGTIALASIGCTLDLHEVYDKVEFHLKASKKKGLTS